MSRKQNLYGFLPRFRHLGNTQQPSFAVAIHGSCIVTYDVIYCARGQQFLFVNVHVGTAAAVS